MGTTTRRNAFQSGQAVVSQELGFMPEQLEFVWADAPLCHPRQAEDTAPQPPPEEPPPSPRPQMQQAANALQRELAEKTGVTIHLRVTDNSSTMMSVRLNLSRTAARVSLHHMFLTAPPTVRRALVNWIKFPRAKKSGGRLDQFIRERRHQIQPRAPRKIRCQTQGRHHDLAALFREVNMTHFGNALNTPITWGNMPKARGRRRSIRFGSYAHESDVIRIHPLLDQDFVPRYFVRYIVFHEMLHAQLGIQETPAGRRRIHPPRFKRIEEAYPDYQRALKWMENKRNIKRLLGTTKRS